MAADAPPVAEESPPWRPCGTCWGQRRIFTTTPEGLVPHACETCLGLGEVPSVDGGR